MGRYVCERIAIGIFALFILASVAFFLTRWMPGSPFQNGNVSEQVIETIEKEYGLSDPVIKQYGIFLENLLQGDFGVSLKKQGVTVEEIITRALPVTLSLGVLSILTAVVIGTALGIWQALAPQKAVKGGIFLGTMLGTGIPNFVVALLLALLFGVKLKLLPIAGIGTPVGYILPVISLAVYPASVITQMIYQTFSEELNREYVLLAKAKGMMPWQVVLTHILKNAWIPVLNYVGPAAAFLLTGSFVVESIFTIPGLGREFVTSIGNRDYTLILGLTVFMGAVVIGINLLTDLLAVWMNPKARRGYL